MSGSEPQPILEVEGLTKHYSLARGFGRGGRTGGGVVRAVDDVSFELREGETLGIVGESGCGKSTTARMLVGLIEPTSGSVRYRGETLDDRGRRRAKELRRELQIVFQDPYSSLNPRRTIGGIVRQPLDVHGIGDGARERRMRVEELLEQVGLGPAYARRYPHELSGGQRQRVGIARALALGPQVLVADEPVSALDVSVQAQVLNLLRELHDQLGLTLVLIAHDLSVVRHMCDRVAVMYLGKLVEIGPTDDLYVTPSHPYTSALLASVPVPDPARRDDDRQALHGDLPSPAGPPSGCRFHTRCPRAQARCAAEEPPLRATAGALAAACHFPLAGEAP